MKGQYNAVDIAKLVITKYNAWGHPISSLKLQKVLYFLWLDYYKETGEHLFDNDFYAGQLGPVVPDVYYEFCQYAGEPIEKDYPVQFSPREDLVLTKLLIQYATCSAKDLVDMSTRRGGPWDRVYLNGKGNFDIIPFRFMMNE